MDPLVLLIAVLAVMVGLALGWFLGGRSGSQWRDKFNEAIVNLAAERKTAERVETAEDEIRQERATSSALAAKIAAFERGEEERQRAHDTQLAQLKDLETKLEARFGELAGKAVEGAHDLFLKRADERFGHAGKQNEEKLKALLQPVEATLTRYETNLREMETARTGAYQGLKEQILLMREGQERVANEANRLRTTLRSSSGSVGRWGEEQCRNALERAGLQEGIDFEEQVSADEHGDRARPDFVVTLSGGRKLIIDVKCSLDAYFGATDTEDDATRELLLAEHAKAIRAHAQGLTRRTYQDRFGGSLSFVVMFVPGENFLHAAIQLDRQLLSWGQDRNVVIVGPTNLVSLALTVASLRGQEKMQARAEEIAKAGRRLYENLATLGKNSHAMSRSIQSMITNWNQLVGTLDGSLLSTARKFDELGLGKSSVDVRELEPLDGSVREPQKLMSPSCGPLDNDPDEILETAESPPVTESAPSRVAQLTSESSEANE